MNERLSPGFPATRHSAVEAVRAGDAAARERGLQAIASAYWRPVYSYLRLHWRRPHEEAADLTQEFFAELQEKEWLTRFDSTRARLRTFLRVCIDGLVSNHERASARQKRGGGSAPFDFESVREEVELLSGSSAEEAFEREWARGVFVMALERLRLEYEQHGRAEHVALLEQYDLADERPTYAQLAQRFGIAVTDVTNRLSRTRSALRRVTLEVLRELTASDEEFREEARALLGEVPR